jgi:hypothetical protein
MRPAMKYYLRSSNQLNSDVEKFIKSVKKHFKGYFVGDFQLADIFSISHGFVNFKSMRLAHTAKQKEIKFQRDEPHIRVEVEKLIPILKAQFDYEKWIMLEDGLSKLIRSNSEFPHIELYNQTGCDNYISHFDLQVNKVLRDYFDNRSFIKKLMDIEVPRWLIKHSNEWKTAHYCIANDAKKLGTIYRNIPLFNAVKNGGIFVIRESISCKFIHYLEILLKNQSITNNEDQAEGTSEKLYIVDLSDEYIEDSEFRIKFQPFKTQAPKDLLAQILKLIQLKEFYHEPEKSEKLRSDLQEMMIGYFNALEYIYGNNLGSLSTVPYEKLIPTLDVLIEMALHDKMPANSLLLQWLVKLPELNFTTYANIALGGKPKAITYEHHSHLLMQFDEDYQSILGGYTYNSNIIPLPNTKYIVNEGRIVVVVISDVKNYQDRDALADFLVSKYIEDAENFVNEKDVPGKTILIDDFSRFSVKKDSEASENLYVFGEKDSTFSLGPNKHKVAIF